MIYFVWKEDAPGYAAYKNNVLVQYQNALHNKCSMPIDDRRLFVQQMIQENGRLDPTLTSGTDKGYSFGLGQWNTYPTLAKTHLSRHPQEATLDWQIEALSKSACDQYNLYKPDTRRAIVAHNCPECSRHNAAPNRCGGVDSVRKISGRWTCYFEDEVNGQELRDRLESSSGPVSP